MGGQGKKVWRFEKSLRCGEKKAARDVLGFFSETQPTKLNQIGKRQINTLKSPGEWDSKAEQAMQQIRSESRACLLA